MSINVAYRAIGDVTRRRILDLLRTETLTAGAIAGQFGGLSRPAVSKHLAILRKARLVRAKKQGREQVYALNAAPLREVNEWLRQYEQFWEQQLGAFKQYVESTAEREKDDDTES